MSSFLARQSVINEEYDNFISDMEQNKTFCKYFDTWDYEDDFSHNDIDYNISLEEDGVFLCKTTSKNKLLEVFNNREVIEWCPRSFSSIFANYIVINIKKECAE